NSWAIEASTTPPFTAYAANPVAAQPALPRGDFDGDGAVTPTDYQIWQQSFGSTSQLAADASGNGVIDAADYSIWCDHLGAATNPASSHALATPEPPIFWPALFAVVVFWRFMHLNRKDKFS